MLEFIQTQDIQEPQETEEISPIIALYSRKISTFKMQEMLDESKISSIKSIIG